MIKKDFRNWMTLKERLHNIGKPRSISEGDVWWYAAGENVRTEINGKSKRFSRPVLVLKKFSKYSFWGIPLTSQEHGGSWYVAFEFRGKVEYAALLQLRNIDVSRLYDRIGRVPDKDLEKVKSGVIGLLSEISEKKCAPI